MKTLYLVRHGQTLFNKLKKMQGWCDSPLTLLGQKQAEVARDYFKEHMIDFTHAYSSTSERASDTLEIITDMPYERRKNLKEISFGVYEAESEHLHKQWPPIDFFVPFGGEHGDDFKKRVYDELTKIMKNEDHQDVLVVAHGGVLSAMMSMAKIDPNYDGDELVHNCTIIKFEYDGENFILKEKIDHDFSHLLDIE